MKTIPVERLRELLDYDPESGALTWRYRPTARRDWNTRWTGKAAGRKNRLGYLIVSIDGGKYFAHRLIWAMRKGVFPAGKMDHANGDASDNRLANLREATHAENMRNVRTHRDNKLGLKGVSEAGHGGRYYARIIANGKLRHLGHYGSPEEAHAAYRRAAEELHGEFAFHRRES